MICFAFGQSRPRILQVNQVKNNRDLERLASLGIMGAQFEASLKPLRTLLRLIIPPYEALNYHPILPRDASFPVPDSSLDKCPRIMHCLRKLENLLPNSWDLSEL